RRAEPGARGRRAVLHGGRPWTGRRRLGADAQVSGGGGDVPEGGREEQIRVGPGREPVVRGAGSGAGGEGGRSQGDLREAGVGSRGIRLGRGARAAGRARGEAGELKRKPSGSQESTGGT